MNTLTLTDACTTSHHITPRHRHHSTPQHTPAAHTSRATHAHHTAQHGRARPRPTARQCRARAAAAVSAARTLPAAARLSATASHSKPRRDASAQSPGAASESSRQSRSAAPGVWSSCESTAAPPPCSAVPLATGSGRHHYQAARSTLARPSSLRMLTPGCEGGSRAVRAAATR